LSFGKRLGGTLDQRAEFGERAERECGFHASTNCLESASPPIGRRTSPPRPAWAWRHRSMPALGELKRLRGLPPGAGSLKDAF